MTNQDSKLYPARARYQGNVARDYLASRTQSKKWQREQQVFDQLIGAFAGDSSVLDVPVGTGRFFDFYARGRHPVFGADISADMIREARSVAGKSSLDPVFIQAEAEAIPLHDRSIDYVVCARLLNWTPGNVLSRIVSELARVARRGLIVEVRVSVPLSRSYSRPRILARGAFVTLRQEAGRLLGLKKKRRDDGEDDKFSHGYVVHDADFVDAVFAGLHLAVRERAVIKERMNYADGVRERLTVFMLQPSRAP